MVRTQGKCCQLFEPG
ncbi:hypothetical protein CSHISOI_11203 [Colletotrichum shisoi]|uniref:Uncharacterized protein n=1 Tax=Colletotrichum shisoi TaxID=2078593 RepID=A0A5Q4BAL5_9PEZI|nr:hypothetical protein CSHISOI_11203 [Colletotrichum shisoi]